MRVIGVIQFPGSCDERDALGAVQRVGEGRLVWHEETDLSGLDGVIDSGRLLLRRLPARRSDRALLAGDGGGSALRGEGGPVLGICNGFQVLCEAGLLPGALLPNEGLRFICRQVGLVAEDFGGPFGAELGSGDRLSIPIKHMSGRYFAPDERARSTRGANGESPFAMRPGENPNGSVRDIAGVLNEAGNVLGLMPHPEHAVDPLTGSDDGLALFGALVSLRPPQAAAA